MNLLVFPLKKGATNFFVREREKISWTAKKLNKIVLQENNTTRTLIN